MSGKTALAQLLVDYLCNKLPDEALIVSTSLLALQDCEGIMDFLARESNGKISPANFEGKSTCPTVLIIDEAQIGYERSTDTFWHLLKGLSATHSTAFSVLLFAAYGDRIVTSASTPVEFSPDNQMDASFLTLLPEEFSELVADFNKVCLQSEATHHLSLSYKVSCMIAELTGSHTGIMYKVLSTVYDHFKNRREAVQDKEVAAFLYGGQMLEAVNSCRAVPELQGEEPRALLSLLLSTKRGFVQEYGGLIKKGAIYVSQSKLVSFSSPLIERAYMHRLLFSGAERCYLDPGKREDFEHTVIAALAGMDPAILSETQGLCSDGLPNERTFQMEFYRSLSRQLPKGVILSADKPAENSGVQGYVDFYVDSFFQWAIELLRQGIERKEHAERFITGAYALLDMKQFLVIDMMMGGKKFKTIPENTWIVVFDPSFITATIHFPGEQPPQGIKICGAAAK
jgi:hypothetical protein